MTATSGDCISGSSIWQQHVDKIQMEKVLVPS